MATKLLEHCQVAPSSGTIAEQLLPLVHFDMIWLFTHPLQHLYFYEIPSCSKSHFLGTIVPSIKNSLSLALNHFTPFAGNIIFPLDNSSKRPVFHYKTGDSVSVTIMESTSDFVHLTGNHQKDADEFHYLVPQLPPSTYSPDKFIKIPVGAVQVTFFPKQGISIGYISHHAIADGSSLLHFLHVWASINKYNGDAHLLKLGDKFLPFYDRKLVEDPNGLDATRWEYMKHREPTVSSTVSLPTYKVRASFFIGENDVQNLKSFVKSSQNTAVSSFTVVCAYVWSCMVRSAAGAGEVLDDDEAEYFTFPVDCRGRLNPPLPGTYFGNCLAVVSTKSTHGRLKRKEGFGVAVEAIMGSIEKTLNNGKGILEGSQERLEQLIEMMGKRVVGVAGSPKLYSYGADFGWGKVKKFELISIDSDGSIYLGKSGEFKGSLEIALSMSKAKMDAFAAIFNQGLKEIEIALLNSRL